MRSCGNRARLFLIKFACSSKVGHEVQLTSAISSVGNKRFLSARFFTNAQVSRALYHFLYIDKWHVFNFVQGLN